MNNSFKQKDDVKTEFHTDQVAWTVCLDCGKRVTGDFIHTCSPQLKTLTDEEIEELAREKGMHLNDYEIDPLGNSLDFGRAILKKASEK